MATYHVTPDGPRTCTDTTGRCPYKKLEKPHFDSHAEAMDYYESAMEEQFGHSGITKTNSVRQKAYAKRDQVTDVASAKADEAKAKFNRAADKGRHEVNQWKGDARIIKGYASSKIESGKRRATASSAQMARITNRVARETQDKTNEKLEQASSAARKHGATASEKTKATARVARKVAILAGRDIARGTRKIEAKYRVRERVKSVVSRVSAPVSRYAKSRARIVRRIAKSEFAPNANRSCRATHCSKPAKKTQSQTVLTRNRDDFVIGA